MNNRAAQILCGQALTVGMFSSLMLFIGCAIIFPPKDIYPITDGFHKTLPQRNARAVVWGSHPTATGSAMTWLQKRGLTIVERAQLQQIFDEQKIRLTHTSDDNAQVLRVGKLIGAEMVVFVDSAYTGGVRGTFSVDPYGGGGSSQTLYSISVSVRGINVETGEVAWTGNARYPQPVINLDDGLTRLTCNALATAWGYRPVGEYDLQGRSMCEVQSQLSP